MGLEETQSCDTTGLAKIKVILRENLACELAAVGNGSFHIDLGGLGVTIDLGKLLKGLHGNFTKGLINLNDG
jgi:hypothetical protein